MLPRRTLRETSRTAKKPANSLVNPWVSRMNSSAKETSPNQPRFAESRPRAADFFLFGQALPDVLETVPDLRLRAGICRQRRLLGKVESSAWVPRRHRFQPRH